MTLRPIFTEINRLRNGKASDDLRAKPHLAKLPTCGKELMKSLGLGIVDHAFNPCTEA